MRITEVERRIVSMMAAGLGDLDIARRSFVSKRTLERQVAGLMQRLGIRSRVALGAIAYRERWIDPAVLDRCPALSSGRDTPVSGPTPR